MIVEKPDGWNEELYYKLSCDFLIECAKNDTIKEWNQAYEAYVRSEWERIFPDNRYDAEDIQELFRSYSISNPSLYDQIIN